MLCLPFLIRILSLGSFEKQMIAGSGFLVVAQVIESRGPQKMGNRNLRQKLHPSVQSFNSQRIVLVLAGSESQISIGLAQVGLEFYGCQKFLLCLWKLLLPK